MTLEEGFSYEPFYRYEQIVVVGLGGTGGQVARCLARLLYHRKQKQQPIPRVLFVDPDLVEPHNVGRQMFTESSIGQPKAQVLATSFNLSLGLQIAWATEPIDSQKHIPHGSLVCGCVDNHHARAEIARARHCVWLDAGNGYDFGQVILGDSDDRATILQGLQNARNKRCYHLPHAGLLMPSLLEPDPDEAQPAVTGLSCAEQMAQDEQQLYVNDFMGNLVAQYIYRLLNREPVTTFITYLNLKPYPQVQSIPIQPSTIARFLG